MKKLAIVALIVLAGCRRQTVTSSPVIGAPVAATEAGARVPREALDRFLASAKAQDLQAMSNIWGSRNGPARSTMDRDVLEKREVVMMKCLKHDRYAVMIETPAAGGARVFSVEMRYKDLTAQTNFTVAPGPSNRWYLEQFEMEPLQRICAAA